MRVKIKQENLLEYIRQDLTQEQMARKEGVTKVTIWNYIKEIDEGLINRAKNEDEEQWKKTEQEQEKKYQQIILEMEERWQNLTKEHESKLINLNKKNNESELKSREIDKDVLNYILQEREILKIKQRQQRLLEYIRQNLTQEQMATKEGTSSRTVFNYIQQIDKDLVQQAQQVGEKLKKIKEIERQQRLLGYIRRNLTQNQMANEEHISPRTVFRYIQQIDEELISRAKSEDEKAWEQTEKEQDDKLQQLRCEMEESWQDLIKKHEERMQQLNKENVDSTLQEEEIDENIVNYIQQEGETLKKVEREKRLLGYLRKNLTQNQMADKEGVSPKTIFRYIHQIDEEFVNQARKEGEALEKIEREKRLLGYIRQNLTQDQMATKEEVSLKTISRYIHKIDEDLVNRAKNEDKKEWKQTQKEQNGKFLQLMYESEERWQDLIQKFEEKSRIDKNSKSENTSMQINSKVTLEKNTKTNPIKLVKIIENKVKSKEITQSDIQAYKKVLDKKYNKVTYEEIVLLIRAYIETEQLEEAIKFLNSIIYNEDMAYLGLEKLNNLKASVEYTKKKQYACKLIESGKTKIAEISQIVRLKGDRCYKNKK